MKALHLLNQRHYNKKAPEIVPRINPMPNRIKQECNHQARNRHSQNCNQSLIKEPLKELSTADIPPIYSLPACVPKGHVPKRVAPADYVPSVLAFFSLAVRDAAADDVDHHEASCHEVFRPT